MDRQSYCANAKIFELPYVAAAGRFERGIDARIERVCGLDDNADEVLTSTFFNLLKYVSRNLMFWEVSAGLRLRPLLRRLKASGWRATVSA
jgi:hypothetical protein